MPEMPWFHLLARSSKSALAVIAVLETWFRKVLVLLAWMNTHLETLEAKQITSHLALVTLLLLWITITLNPPRELLCRLADLIKPSTRPAMKKLRMGGVL